MTTRPTVHWMGLTRETWSQKPKEPGRLTSDLWQKSCPWTKPTKPCSDSHSWIKWWTTGEQTVMSAHVCSSVCPWGSADSSVCPWGSADSSVCPWGSADGNAWCFTYRAYLEVLTVTAQEHVWWTSWHTTDICTGWGRHTEDTSSGRVDTLLTSVLDEVDTLKTNLVGKLTHYWHLYWMR